MLRRVWFLAILVPAALPGQSAPRARPGPETPLPPYERMTAFEGTWTMEPGAAFQSGATTPAANEENCAFMPGGRRHMVCRTWSERTPGGPRSERMYILSYRDRDSVYVAHHAFAGGATLTYHGRIEGDRWVMNLQPTPFWPANERLRTIITLVPDGMRYVEEHSVDGGPWKVTEDYRYRKLR
jgi:hypothetical protein